MSGDVQPRKRKDKRKRKDELGLEEPKGTAAALGDGDVFLHSYHDHGTGGHWCAKIIFFSLLAVLVALIGLIILENRGLTELEANSVQTQYSGVLDGWLEDAPDDDHHNIHTLDLNHPDKESEEQEIKYYDEHESLEVADSYKEEQSLNSDEEDLGNDDENYEDHYDSNEEDQDRGDIEENSEEDQGNSDENDDDREQYDSNEDQDRGDIKDNSEEDGGNSIENSDDENNDDDNEDEIAKYDYETYTRENDDESIEYQKDENEEDHDDSDDHDDDDDDDEQVAVEHIEEEPSDLEPISTELPALPEEDDDEHKHIYKEDDDDDDDDNNDIADDDNDDHNESNDDDDDDYLEPPVVEHVSAPSGKPYLEFEDSTEEVSPDTLAQEEEYEKQQEELRRQEEESTSHMWLKLGVGAALLAATHALMRRATRGNTEESDDSISLTDRRMTLIPSDDEETDDVPTPIEVAKKVVPKEKVKQTPILIQTTKPTVEEEDEEEIKTLVPEPTKIRNVQSKPEVKKEISKEYYSDEDSGDEVENIPEIPKVDNDENNDQNDFPDDVEIINEEEIDENEEIDEEIDDEMEEDEEISDVDDAELLNRLEAKYGRLPEPYRPDQRHKNGGNNMEDFWPDEPDDPYWREQLDQAEQQLHEDTLSSLSSAILVTGAPKLDDSARARWIKARAIDRKAEILRDNKLLEQCIVAYIHLLELNVRLPDKLLLMVTNRTLDRMNFKGNYLRTEQVHRILINRFPNDPAYRNNLTISFLMSNRADKAVTVLKETLTLWPDDRVALAHFGFVQKTLYNQLEESVSLFRRALEGDKGPAVEPRFYYHLGDALLLLGRKNEANEVHERGAALGMFLSANQRSLYNVDRLKSQPWWDVNKTPYRKLARTLEKFWREILDEGERARALYEEEKEGLREKGEWSQLDLFVRGREVPGRCSRAAITCEAVRVAGGGGCTRGQVKFSVMSGGTHVRPHVGPTNCRLRMHLALSNTEHTYLRVGNETRQWEVGKVLMFDDSFEHEVWHNGTKPRLVLIVDVWHPDLTEHEKRTLPAI